MIGSSLKDEKPYGIKWYGLGGEQTIEWFETLEQRNVRKLDLLKSVFVSSTENVYMIEL